MKGKLGALFAILIALAGCQFQVPSGYVGIIYDMYGNDKGVQAKAVPPGMWPINMTQKSELYPSFTGQYKFDKEQAVNFSSKDGNTATVEIGIQANTDVDHAPRLFQKYREQFTDVIANQVHLRLRDYFNQYGVDYNVAEIYGEKRNELLARVSKSLSEEFEKEGLLITTVSYLSRPRFSDQIESAIESKVKTEQDTLQKQFQVAQARAEADIQVARATGEAAANVILARSISPEILQLKALQNQEAFIEALKSGKATMPTTYVTGAGTQTMIPLK